MSDREELKALRRLAELEAKAKPSQKVAPEKQVQSGMRGGLEGIAALASGAVAGPVSGYAGVAGSILPGPQGQGAEWQRKTQEALTYQPRTEIGQKGFEQASYPFVKLSELAHKAGGAVTDIAGAGAGTAANVALNSIPFSLGTALPKIPKTAAPKSANPAMANAVDAGYVLTPTQQGRGVLSRAAEGLSGSAKMEKLASVKNQKITNKLISDELGLNPREPITTRALETKRAEAGRAYEAVKSSVKAIKPDAQFRKDIESLRGDYTNAAKEYPDLINNAQVENLISSLNVERASPSSMIELTRKLRKDASANLKSYDSPDKQALGFAQRNASAALEELIDRALTSVGKGGLVADFRKARQQIAKTYDVEAALNETTGDVSARYFAKLYDKGKPLTGNMEKVAKFAQAFEGSARDVAKMRDVTDFSYGDILMGGMGGLTSQIASGNPMGLAAMGTRPLMRHLLLNRAQSNQPLISLKELGRTQRGLSTAQIAAGIQDQESR